MSIKKPVICAIGLMLLSTTLVGAYLSVNGISIPDDNVTLNAVDGTDSYFNITLSNVPGGYDIENGLYPGWCADRAVTMIRSVDHIVTLYDSYDPSLPVQFQGQWNKINWILNNKGAYSMQVIQDACWYLLGDYTWGQISTSAKELVNLANGTFIPEAGEILAIVAVPTAAGCQCTFIEIEIPCTGDEGLSPGYWKNHLSSWYTYDDETEIGDVFTIPSSLSELDDDTFLAALNYRGGNKVIGAARILLRSAVAALLNAAHPDIDYPLSTSAIISDVNDALASLNRATILDLKDVLDGYNNLGAEL
jgi:hypothetical protein